MFPSPPALHSQKDDLSTKINNQFPIEFNFLVLETCNVRTPKNFEHIVCHISALTFKKSDKPHPLQGKNGEVQTFLEYTI